MSHGGLKRARSWKRRLPPKEAYRSPGLLYSESCDNAFHEKAVYVKRSCDFDVVFAVAFAVVLPKAYVREGARDSAGSGGVSIGSTTLSDCSMIIGSCMEITAESRSARMSHITLDQKHTGKPSAGNLHAGFDEAGTGNRLTIRLVRHSQRKRGAIDRPSLRGAAPVLDPTKDGRNKQQRTWGSSSRTPLLGPGPLRTGRD